jgi:hypothetical protein
VGAFRLRSYSSFVLIVKLYNRAKFRAGAGVLKSWVSLSAVVLLAAIYPDPAAAAAAEPCAPPPLAAAPVVELSSVLSEDDRLAMSAAIHLTVGAAAAERRAAPSPPACQVANFEVEGVEWLIAARAKSAVDYHVTSSERTDSFVVIPGVDLEDARGWAASRSPVARLTKPPIYYLIAKAHEDGDLFFLRMYRAAPGSKQVADDIVAALDGRLAPFAAYNTEGQATTVLLPTTSGVQAEIFDVQGLGDSTSAHLYGPDGTFFQAFVAGSVTLRGSEEVCPAAVGRFELSAMSVLQPRDVGLDLGCRYDFDDSRISMFVSHVPDKRSDRARFARATLDMQEESGVKRSAPGFRPVRGGVIRSGKAWIDREGVGQGLWFMRRGEYVIEIRATFETSLGDDVFDFVATVAEGLPAARDNPG